MSQHDFCQFDVLIVGAGPAGIAAAVSAAEAGARVGLLDEGPGPGGQIWRGGKGYGPTADGWLARLRSAHGVTALARTRVLAPAGANGGGIPRPYLLVEGPEGPRTISYGRLILATGARERFLPFPGWTLPGVTGAGGLQALAKGGWPIAGKRVVVAGSGPLLLAVAAGLRRGGADVRLVAEQAAWGRLLPFGLRMLRTPGKLLQAAGLRAQLRGVSYRAGCWVERAEGDGRLEAVLVRQGGHVWRERCDLLACGFGLVPNTELAAALGCAIESGAVAVDGDQRTSVAAIFAAGEVAGIGGVEAALAEGAIAGYVAAGHADRARSLLAQRAAARRFAAQLERTFALREELRHLAQPQTIVCRCEDVDYAALAEHSSWRSAKIHTRCGMGPCQGRVCGAATEVLFGWTQDSVRPPIAPAALSSFIMSNTTADTLQATELEEQR